MRLCSSEWREYGNVLASNVVEFQTAEQVYYKCSVQALVVMIFSLYKNFTLVAMLFLYVYAPSFYCTDVTSKFSEFQEITVCNSSSEQ